MISVASSASNRNYKQEKNTSFTKLQGTRLLRFTFLTQTFLRTFKNSCRIS